MQKYVETTTNGVTTVAKETATIMDLVNPTIPLVGSGGNVMRVGLYVILAKLLMN